MSLVTRNGVNLYEHTDSWEKLKEGVLSSLSDFYSTLIELHIEDGKYEHAIQVWNHLTLRLRLHWNRFRSDPIIRLVGRKTNYV